MERGLIGLGSHKEYSLSGVLTQKKSRHEVQPQVLKISALWSLSSLQLIFIWSREPPMPGIAINGAHGPSLNRCKYSSFVS